MSSKLVRPLIGITACRRQLDPHPYHVVGEKYVDAVVDGAGGMPFLMPSLGSRLDLDEILNYVDGILLTGSPSNVEPHHYDGSPDDSVPPHDPERDATTLPLIRAAAARGVPLFAICRGYQEVNVAFGGSLAPRVYECPGKLDHRENKSIPIAQQYAPVHDVQLTAGGVLQHLWDGADLVAVNSLHSQGVERLGDGLRVEARAPDGLIEAFTINAAPAFNLAVQWHPEWQVTRHRYSMALFRAFGEACSERRLGAKSWAS